jgi:uncharacterized protein (TIGR00730 family)
MADENRIVTVFGSSRPRMGDADYDEARLLGAALAGHGFLVCSGGYGGVMEAVSRGAKEAGGRTLAVTAGVFRSRANAWIDEERAVDTWEERLFELIRAGDGYVACKGGTGTLVELAAVWEMLNKGFLTDKPFVVLGDFWVPILDRVREVELGHGSRWGEAEARLARHAATPTEAAELLAQAFARASPKDIDHKRQNGRRAKRAPR